MREAKLHSHSNGSVLDDLESNSGICYYGVVTAQVAGSTTTAFECAGLAGWGDDDFIHLYYVQIRRTTDRSAPERERGPGKKPGAPGGSDLFYR